MTTQNSQVFWLSTIGKKYFMGISGLVWAGFVFGHMAGNMLMFVSKDLYNAYGHALTSGYMIYAIEAVLLSTIAGHVFFGFLLTYQNRVAKNQRYAVTPKGPKSGSLASRTMIFQGTIVLVFLILHLITFKYGAVYETTVNGVVMRDLHRLLIEVFQQPVYVVGYVVSLILLGVHLSHGVGSTLQSLGLKTTPNENTVRTISWVYGVVVAVGFLSQPIYIYLFNN